MDKITNFIGNVTGNQRTNEDGTPQVNAPPVVPILPMRLQGQLPPYPPAPTQFMTDAEIHLNRQNNRLVENQKLSTKVNEGMEDFTGKDKTAGTRAKGLWGVVANGVKKGIVEVQIGAHSTAHSTSSQSQHQRFRTAFAHVAEQGAEFHSSHEGQVIHQGRAMNCGIFITSTHLCINGSGLNDSIPYKNIVSVIPCVSLTTVDLTPFLMPAPNTSVIPTACEVFVRLQTIEGQGAEYLKYQFLGITDSSVKQLLDSSTKQFGPCIKFLADLDKSWRHCTTVPVPNMQYQQQGYTGGNTRALSAAASDTPFADQPPPTGAMSGTLPYSSEVQRDRKAVAAEDRQTNSKESAPLPEDATSPTKTGGEEGTVPSNLDATEDTF